MPISLDSNQTFNLVLKSDKEKKKAPYFKFRFLTNREYKNLLTAIDSVEKTDHGNPKGILCRLEDALRIPLVGWGNMGGKKYNPKDIDDLLTPGEIKELIAAVLDYTVPDTDEKKASKSRAR